MDTCVTTIVFSVLFGLSLMILFVLPKPIPGIPYNKGSQFKVFGDMPDIIRAMKITDNQLFAWAVSQNIKLKSPIVQVFAQPFKKPWILLTDYRECIDVMLRRTKEFDRSDFAGGALTGIMPDMHVNKRTESAEFKYGRALLNDLMTPTFIDEVC